MINRVEDGQTRLATQYNSSPGSCRWRPTARLDLRGGTDALHCAASHCFKQGDTLAQILASTRVLVRTMVLVHSVHVPWYVYVLVYIVLEYHGMDVDRCTRVPRY
jgi:hypothetical protein